MRLTSGTTKIFGARVPWPLLLMGIGIAGMLIWLLYFQLIFQRETADNDRVGAQLVTVQGELDRAEASLKAINVQVNDLLNAVESLAVALAELQRVHEVPGASASRLPLDGTFHNLSVLRQMTVSECGTRSDFPAVTRAPACHDGKNQVSK